MIRLATEIMFHRLIVDEEQFIKINEIVKRLFGLQWKEIWVNNKRNLRKFCCRVATTQNWQSLHEFDEKEEKMFSFYG